MHLLAAALFDQRTIERIHSWNIPSGAPDSPTRSICASVKAGVARLKSTLPPGENVKISSSLGNVMSFLLPKLSAGRVREQGTPRRFPGLLDLGGNSRWGDRDAVRGGCIDKSLHAGSQGERGVHDADLWHASSKDQFVIVDTSIRWRRRIAGEIDQDGADRHGAADGDRGKSLVHALIVRAERHRRFGWEGIDARGPVWDLPVRRADPSCSPSRRVLLPRNSRTSARADSIQGNDFRASPSTSFCSSAEPSSDSSSVCTSRITAHSSSRNCVLPLIRLRKSAALRRVLRSLPAAATLGRLRIRQAHLRSPARATTTSSSSSPREPTSSSVRS